VRVRPRWREWARAQLLEEARGAVERGEDLCAILFARDRALSLPAQDPAQLDAARLERLELGLEGAAGSSTDFAGALGLAEAVARSPGRPGGRVLVFSDRRWTDAAPETAIAQLARDGFSCETRELPPAELADLALVSLRLPARVEPGAPLVGEIALAFEPGPTSAGGSIALEVELEDSAGARKWSVATPLPVPADSGPGARVSGARAVATVRIELGAAAEGLTRCRVCAHLRGDPVPENDCASGFATCGSVPLLTVIALPASKALAQRWLGAGDGRDPLPGIQRVFAAPEELESWLGRCDAVVSVDVSPEDLPIPALASFVQAGGGWLLLGGWDLLARWHPPRNSDESLLPLEPSEEDLPPREIVLLVDGSGSMAGRPFEALQRAALELVGAASPRDAVGLRWFTSALEPPAILRPAGETDARVAVAAAQRALSARVPGGSTNLAGALATLTSEREAAREPGSALVLLLTDGRDQPAGAEQELRNLRARLAAARTELAIFAVGERADRGFLERLLLPGESLRSAEDPEQLARLFLRELERERVREGQLSATWVEPRSLPQGSLGAEVAAAGAQAPLAAFERCWRARALPRVQALWLSDAGEPLLALAQRGLGATAAWASSPSAGWSPNYDARVLAALLRALVRGHRESAERLSLALESEGSGGDRLALENVPPGWPAVVRARFVGGEPDTASPSWILTPPAVGLAGPGSGASGGPLRVRESAARENLRRAAAAAASHGTVQIELTDGTARGPTSEPESPGSASPDEPSLARLTLDAPGDPEFALEPAPRILARDPAGRSGRGGSASGGARDAGRGRREGPHPAAPWVLLLGLAALGGAAVVGMERR
jgi:VWA domain-containing protein